MIEERYGHLEKQLRETENQLNIAYEKIKQLENKEEELKRNNIEALTKYILSKTPINRARPSMSGQTFDEWQRQITSSLKKEITSLRSALFKESMDSILENNPSFKRIPFIYYDFENKKTIYTQGFLDIFDIESEEDFHLRRLIRKYLGEEQSKSLETIFRKGEFLEKYSIQTLEQPPRNFLINGYPLTHNQIPIGAGVFIYNPNSNTGIIPALRFGVKVRKKIKQLQKTFKIINKKSN